MEDIDVALHQHFGRDRAAQGRGSWLMAMCRAAHDRGWIMAMCWAAQGRGWLMAICQAAQGRGWLMVISPPCTSWRNSGEPLAAT